jgi:Zn-dependent protease
MDINLYAVIVQFVVLLLSLSVHESAHAWTADRLGDPTARYLGRVSLNPIVHADLFGTIIFPIIGMFYGFMLGWAKPVPVNLSRLRNPRRDHMLVAAAGPMSNFTLAALLFVVLMVVKSISTDGAFALHQVASFDFSGGNPILTPLTAIAYHGILINIVLGVFNLIPVAPLDGAAVLSALLPRSFATAFEEIQNYGFVLLIALLYIGVPAMLYMPVILFVQSLLFPI